MSPLENYITLTTENVIQAAGETERKTQKATPADRVAENTPRYEGKCRVLQRQSERERRRRSISPPGGVCPAGSPDRLVWTSPHLRSLPLSLPFINLASRIKHGLHTLMIYAPSQSLNQHSAAAKKRFLHST